MPPSFSQLGVPTDLSKVLAQAGAVHPFPVQLATLPDALAGRDVCGKAPTGSGKTLAFGIAIVLKVAKAKPHRPTALILVPTRELANQVRDELTPLASQRGMTVAAVFGGTGFDKQLRALKSGIDIIVACPGRLEDLMTRGEVNLGDVGMLVIDEADRMADMGFIKSVKRIADKTASSRQTLLFSATLDGEIDVLIKRYQRNPATHTVAVAKEDQGDVAHHFWAVERAARVDITARLACSNSPAIVFSRTTRGADKLAKQLVARGVNAVPIHGRRSQNQRETALAKFSNGSAKVLVATDVAARGIHVDRVAIVVHYDLPATDKDYIHRSGRTGRAGHDGIVVSTVPPELLGDAQDLQRALKVKQGLAEINDSLLMAEDAMPPKPPPVVDPPVQEAPSVGNGDGNRGGRGGSRGLGRGGPGARGRVTKPGGGPRPSRAD